MNPIPDTTCAQRREVSAPQGRPGRWAAGALLAAVLLLALIACTPTPENARPGTGLPPIYPDYCDVTIPKNIAPLNFLLRTDCEAIEVRVEGGAAGGTGQPALVLNARGNEAVFDAGEWRELLERSAGTSLRVTVSTLSGGQWTQHRPFLWHVARDPIDPYLTYRLIEPDYEIWNHLQIQQRCVENFEVNAIGHHEQLDNRCMNCHTYAGQDPRLSMMYVRGEGGGAILNRNGSLSKLNLKSPDMVSGSVYFGFSPGGRYIAFSTNIIIPGFHTLAGKRLEVFDSKSDVYVADLHAHTILRSPLLSDSTVFETFPTFSPDGKFVYYCAADSVQLPRGIKRLQYSLVRIPFDLASGRFGTRVDTLFNARSPEHAGRPASVCHPRISPDGRFLLFTVAHYGTFPIWHPEADQRLMDLTTELTDTLAVVNSARSDTYHSWSSNSRWFVFASKRDDGLYGKPYFCYVDRNGKAHKPFCLPQQHPSFYDNNLKSFNAPELGKGRLPFDVDDVARALKQEAVNFR